MNEKKKEGGRVVTFGLQAVPAFGLNLLARQNVVGLVGATGGGEGEGALCETFYGPGHAEDGKARRRMGGRRDNMRPKN